MRIFAVFVIAASSLLLQVTLSVQQAGAADRSKAGRFGICTKNEVLRLLDAKFVEADIRRLCITRKLPPRATLSKSGQFLIKDPNPAPPAKKRTLSLIELPPPEKWRGDVGAYLERERWQPAYDAQGRPLSEADFKGGLKAQVRAIGFPRRVVPVSSEQSLRSALQTAKPGDYIELQPGTYHIKHRQGLALKVPGRRDAPIALGTKLLGTVKVRFEAREGFIVSAPFWIVENLDIAGVCNNHSACHHAFHVVGKASSFVMRNNRVRDFNAQLKVNAVYDDNPDFGLVEGNTIYDSEGRKTGASVTKLNINTASFWTVRGNLIANFEKRGGNGISYGAFMKGNSSNGIFDGNIVACYMGTVPKTGVRLGLSFGGGGTAQRYCRDQTCTSEHTGGIIRNNIIVNCPIDVGIYLNKSTDTLIYNNLILKTRGIDSRFTSSSVRVFNNVIDGRVKERDGGVASADHNLVVSGYNVKGVPLGTVFRKLSGLNLAPTDKGLNMLQAKGGALPDATSALDICGNVRDSETPTIGPVKFARGNRCSLNGSLR